mgnify:CR=1 FL=1
MRISVVVPVYNVEKYLFKCVNSILQQTYKDLEIILVDDGSTDESGIICDELATMDNRIIVIHQTNQGLSAARNTGIENSHGEFIGFVDGDDFIEPTMYEVMARHAIDDCVDMCVVGINDVYEGSIPIKVDVKEYIFTCVEAYKEIMIGSIVPVAVCPKIFKRELFDNVRFTVGKYYEDVFFLSEMMPLVKLTWATTERLYNYVHRSESITTQSFNKKHLDIIDAYQKNYDVIMDLYPSLEREAMFRCYWSYFNVLDRLLSSDSYKSYPEYYDVVNYLKKNAINIAGTEYFSSSRRVSALLLKINVNFYKFALLIKEKRYKIKD